MHQRFGGIPVGNARGADGSGTVAERPLWTHLSVFFVAYVVFGGLSQGLAIIPGIAITFWPPAGIFMATLIMSPRATWPWWILVAGLAELTCNAIWFRNHLALALVYFTANALEAMTGAWLLQRARRGTFWLDSLEDVAAFLVLCVAIAPMVGATVIAGTDALIGKHAFQTAWMLVWLGDATGLLVSAPLAIVSILLFRERDSIAAVRLLEALALAGILLSATVLSFLGPQSTIYLALPPLLWIAARFQLRGAAAGLAAMALLAAALMSAKTGLPAGVSAEPDRGVIALQMFFALAAVSALIVGANAAENRRARHLLRSANESLEARIAERTASLARSERTLTAILEALPIGVSMIDTDGRPLLANAVFAEYVQDRVPSREPSSQGRWEGYHPDGSRIQPQDFSAARALRGERVWPGQDFLFHGSDGPPRWTRVAAIPLRNAAGEVVGATTVIADIDVEKRSLDALQASEQRLGQTLAALQASDRRLALALEAGRAGTWESIPATGEFFASDAALRRHGLPPGTTMTQALALEVVHPDDRAMVEAALQHTLATGEPFDLDLRCVWPDGSVHWLHSQAELRRENGQAMLAGVVQDISHRKEAEAVTARLAALVASSSEAIIGKTLDGTVTSWNSAAERMFGYTAAEMVGQSILSIVPADRQDEERRIISRVAAGDRVPDFETAAIRKDGKAIEVSATISPIIDAAGRVIGAAKIARDISFRKRVEERERLLMYEVNHRSKNILAVVQAIARQTAMHSPEDFQARFSARLQALSANQDVLVSSGWKGVPLDALVRGQLGHFADLVDRRIRVAGPPIGITPSAAQAIGLAIYELATNAVKYGALSNATGTVSIDWKLSGDSDEPDFVLSWVESGGPPVTHPPRQGFGSRMTGTMVELSVSGQVEARFDPDGLVWTLCCPADKVIDPDRG